MTTAPAQAPLSPTRAALLLLLGSLLLTSLSGWAAYRVNASYFKNHSFFFDPVSYQFRNARLSEQVRADGRWATALDEWLHNDRFPLRTIPLILLAPYLLAEPQGYMATALPALAVFLALLGWIVWRRSGSLAYAIAGMALFASIPGFYDPRAGLGVYLLDLPAALWCGAAIICLLQWDGGKHRGWLAAFAVFASFAALSRYVAAGYLLVMAGPVLAELLWRRRDADGIFQAVVKPLLLVASLVGILAGYYLLVHFRNTMDFYAVYGYNLHSGVANSAWAVWRFFTSYLGYKLILFILVLLLLNLLCGRVGGRNRFRPVSLCWMALAHPLFLILVLGMGSHAQAAIYTLCPMFLLALAPWPERTRLTSKNIMAFAAAGIFLVSVYQGVASARANLAQARMATAMARRQKAMDQRLGKLLALQGDHLVWLALFDEYSWPPTLEAFFNHGKLPLPAGQDYFFSVHGSVWRGNFPGLSDQEICRQVSQNIHKYVDLVVVFHDPTQAQEKLKNRISVAVAQFMARTMQTDPGWRRAFLLKDTPYGPLTGYIRRQPGDPGGYRKLLKGKPLADLNKRKDAS